MPIHGIAPTLQMGIERVEGHGSPLFLTLLSEEAREREGAEAGGTGIVREQDLEEQGSCLEEIGLP